MAKARRLSVDDYWADQKVVTRRAYCTFCGHDWVWRFYGDDARGLREWETSRVCQLCKSPFVEDWAPEKSNLADHNPIEGWYNMPTLRIWQRISRNIYLQRAIETECRKSPRRLTIRRMQNIVSLAMGPEYESVISKPRIRWGELADYFFKLVRMEQAER